MAKITTHEAMPFPLAKPNSDTFVTEGENVGWGNKPMTQAIEEKNDNKSTTGNANYKDIENKVNALIDCLLYVVKNAVFYAGTPYVPPADLETKLNLLRYSLSGTSTTSAVCGQAICGQAICGVN